MPTNNQKQVDVVAWILPLDCVGSLLRVPGDHPQGNATSLWVLSLGPSPRLPSLDGIFGSVTYRSISFFDTTVPPFFPPYELFSSCTCNYVVLIVHLSRDLYVGVVSRKLRTERYCHW